MFGQANYFLPLWEKKFPTPSIAYHKEAVRLYKVLDQQLGKKEYLAGAYTIADIATYPWVWRHEWPSGEAGRVSQRETLVRHDLGATGGSARDGEPKV